MTEELYPEHAKLRNQRQEHAAIETFISFLEERDYEIKPPDGRYIRPETLIAEYFEIDLKKFDEEKHQMLAEIRKAQGI